MNSLIDRHGKNKIITESTIINSWKSCKLIGEYLPDGQCVYAVSVNRSIVYIGSAVDLKARLWFCSSDNPISLILVDKQCPVYELSKTKGIRTCLRLGLFDVYNLVVHYKIWDGYSKDRFKLEYQLIESIKPVLNVAGAYREPDYNPVQEFFKNYHTSVDANQSVE